MPLTFSPLLATFMTYPHTKVQGQWSVGSKDRVETNGQTDGGDCITSLANAVCNKYILKVNLIILTASLENEILVPR